MLHSGDFWGISTARMHVYWPASSNGRRKRRTEYGRSIDWDGMRDTGVLATVERFQRNRARQDLQAHLAGWRKRSFDGTLAVAHVCLDRMVGHVQNSLHPFCLLLRRDSISSARCAVQGTGRQRRLQGCHECLSIRNVPRLGNLISRPTREYLVAQQLFSSHADVGPIRSTRPPPAFFELPNNFDIPTATVRSITRVGIQPVDQAAKVLPEQNAWNKVLGKVVQDPMSQGNKRPDSHDAAKVVFAVHRPAQPRN
ncbi:hypothetical protein BKA80DRAFT_272069 [Phyllosticta citrichinensis]